MSEDSQGRAQAAGDDIPLEETISNPELIFGMAGPIGVDLNGVVNALVNRLRYVRYNAIVIHITDYMETSKIDLVIDKSSYFKKYSTLIEYANKFRQVTKSDAAMAGLAVNRIRIERAKISGSENDPALGTAFIIRQFKRPEEIELMRATYGRKFIQISAYSSPSERQDAIIEKIRHFDNSPKDEFDCEKMAIELIKQDYNQRDVPNGQRISDVFHLGDVFAHGSNESASRPTIERFIDAMFGSNRISPKRDEYGLYIATSAALRSADLSRQVGSAVFTMDGEVLTMGCNEVPKANGGTYWSDEAPNIWRDIDIGRDPNQERRDQVLYDLLDRMGQEAFISETLIGAGSVESQVSAVLRSELIRDSQFMDLLEFGRVIHAEMSAICDAARLGRALAGCVMFVTTFPCHICAKHIVACGIKRVVFLEPYPKSYAKQLHGDSITYEKSEVTKVLFEPFIGISPRRYRDIFEKKKRKEKSGKAKEWYEDTPKPMIQDRGASYIKAEDAAIFVALKDIV
jgi:deoxycytidylate deaminase